jgi:hypothetical protein
LAAVGVVAYLRSAQLPFISDDYIQVDLGWKYGALSGWRDLILDPLYRCRSTSLVLTYWTWRFFDLNPLAYNWSSIVLHVLNTWLVFGLGAWRLIGWRPAAVAAGFFAIYEGHQEAVMWYAALPELPVFFFTVLAFLCWVLWLQSGCRRHRYYVAALAVFLLALASKESSVVAVPLMLAAAAVERPRWRRTIPRLVPMAVLGVAYALLIHASRSEHPFYHDGTFSLSAPFLKTLTVSIGRLFWFWGLASVLVLLALRPSRWRRTLIFAAVWIVVTFLPYSFLTYMPRVPSRHTYLASAGLSLVVAAALLAFRARAGPIRGARRSHRIATPVRAPRPGTHLPAMLPLRPGDCAVGAGGDGRQAIQPAADRRNAAIGFFGRKSHRRRAPVTATATSPVRASRRPGPVRRRCGCRVYP